MKKLLLLVSVLSISSVFAQSNVSQKLSSAAIDKALSVCNERVINISSDELYEKRSLSACGGTISFSKSNGGQTAHVQINGVDSCSNLSIGLNSSFKQKSVTRNYKMDGSNRNYRKNITIAKSTIHSHDSKKLMRLAIYSNSGKTCERVYVSLGKKTAN